MSEINNNIAPFLQVVTEKDDIYSVNLNIKLYDDNEANMLNKSISDILYFKDIYHNLKLIYLHNLISDINKDKNDLLETELFFNQDKAIPKFTLSSNLMFQDDQRTTVHQKIFALKNRRERQISSNKTLISQYFELLIETVRFELKYREGTTPNSNIDSLLKVFTPDITGNKVYRKIKTEFYFDIYLELLNNLLKIEINVPTKNRTTSKIEKITFKEFYKRAKLSENFEVLEVSRLETFDVEQTIINLFNNENIVKDLLIFQIIEFFNTSNTLMENNYFNDKTKDEIIRKYYGASKYGFENITIATFLKVFEIFVVNYLKFQNNSSIFTAYFEKNNIASSLSQKFTNRINDMKAKDKEVMKLSFMTKLNTKEININSIYNYDIQNEMLPVTPGSIFVDTDLSWVKILYDYAGFYGMDIDIEFPEHNQKRIDSKFMFKEPTKYQQQRKNSGDFKEFLKGLDARETFKSDDSFPQYATNLVGESVRDRWKKGDLKRKLTRLKINYPEYGDKINANNFMLTFVPIEYKVINKNKPIK